MKLSRETKLAAAIYGICLLIYLVTAGNRLGGPSGDIHFSYQAQMFLQRRLDLGHPPPSSNDWAEVEYLHLKDGRTVAGAFQRLAPSRFRQLNGKITTVGAEDIVRREKKYYVSFPPFPALVFAPFVAIGGLRVNDVLLTAILAALGPALLFLALRHLRARADSLRSEREDLALVALFAVGSVYYYASVIGQVWYTAHIVATALTGLYVLAAFEARSPILAGLTLGAIVLTRPQMGFWVLFFLSEAWRYKRLSGRTLIRFVVPIALFGIAAAAFNYARFHSFTEFGHSYLNVRWTDRIQRYGLFNLAFLSRNLTAAFTLLPKLLSRAPFVQVSWHGMSMLLTTPALIYLLWPRVKGPLHRPLWAVVVPIAAMSFLYQNDGWVQFGYRFSIDYLFGLVLLLAIGGRPFNRTFYILLLVGIAVNVFGAVTFGRMWQFYFDGFFPISPSEL